MRWALALLLAASPAAADIVVPARTIPALSVIGPDDLVMHDAIIPGSIENPDDIIGMETRIALFAGRPIRPSDVGFPAVVNRNQIVPLVFANGGLMIETEGRALDRAGPGEVIRVMNLASRSTVSARIGADGKAYVSQ